MSKLKVSKSNRTNYFIRSLKIKTALSLKRLDDVSKIKTEGVKWKDSIKWNQKKNYDIAYIKLSLSYEQALQLTAEDNAKVLGKKIKSTFISQAKDRRIDFRNEVKWISKWLYS